MTCSAILAPGSYGFHSLQCGDVLKTASAEISADLIDRFAALTGDQYAIHMDESAARGRGFKTRVAHGLLVLSVVDGLKFRSEAKLDGLASLGWNWQFERPVFAGDVVRAELTVIEKHTTQSGKRGIATLRLEVFNQHEKRVQQGTNDLIFKL